MATISNTPRPGYVWDSTDNVWYPIGTGPHTHADYITSGSAINPNIVDAKGDIIAATAADTVSRLAVGANDTVLTADSTTATGLKWATPSAGGMTLIQETVASAVSSIDFTSLSGSYKQLILVWYGIQHSTTATKFSIRLNADSGSNYKNSTYTHENQTTGTTYTGGGGASETSITAGDHQAPFGWYATGSGAGDGANGYIVFENPFSTSKLKYYHGHFSFYSTYGTASYRETRVFGVYDSTSAISQINIIRGAGSATFSNITNTSIRLYGVS